jgi:sialic acid synthase SpsE
MSIFVIAEIGVNHDGSLDKAKRLIDAAKAAGADAAKFQFFRSQKLWHDDRIAHLELRFSEMVVLHHYCAQVGIEFMCTPFGMEEVILLRPLLKRYKIASGCLTRRPILEAVSGTQLPVILSTGMSTQEEIGAAIEVLDGTGTCELTLLHCTSAYPCAIQDVNLKAMETMLHWHRCPVGYSDHTLGITVAIAAAAMGAQVIEKHLTLDCTASGPDHKASIEPEEFRVMVSAIRTVEEALGDGVKRCMASEEKLREAWRVVAPADSAA